MRIWSGLLIALTVAALAGASSAQPTIGVFFDKQGTQDDANARAFDAVTAYIVATHTEQTVGGAAIPLQMDNRLALISAPFPAGIQIGDLLSGIQIGFTKCYYGFYGEPVLLATMDLMPAVNDWYYAILNILPYPAAGVIQLADCNAEVTTASPAHWSSLTVNQRMTVGVYWDQAGTQTYHTANGGVDETHTAYIIAKDTETWIGSAAFKLEMDPRITLTGATFAPGTQSGTLAEGVSVSFDPPQDGQGQPVLIATLSLWTGDQIIADGWLQIAPDPSTGTVQLAGPRCDFPGCVYAADGDRATLTIPIRTEDKSWGEVKSLYGR